MGGIERPAVERLRAPVAAGVVAAAVGAVLAPVLDLGADRAIGLVAGLALLVPVRRLLGDGAAEAGSPAASWRGASAGTGLLIAIAPVVVALTGARPPWLLVVGLALSLPLVLGPGLRALVREEPTQGFLLDTALSAVTAGFVAWVLFWRPNAAATPDVVRFDLASVVVLAMFARLAGTGGRVDRRARPFLWLACTAWMLGVAASVFGDPPSVEPATIGPLLLGGMYVLLLVAGWWGQLADLAVDVPRVPARAGGAMSPMALAIAAAIAAQAAPGRDGLEISLSTVLLLIVAGRAIAAILDLRRAHRAAERQASADVLTGLRNRSWITDELPALLCEGEVRGLLLVDLDRFKRINDTRGHHVGDRVLEVAAQRLSVAAGGAPVVRLGGDEFVVAALGATNPVQLADTLRLELARPVEVAGQDLTLSCSVGVVTDLARDAEPWEILVDADTAMYEAKRAGGDATVAFGPALRIRAERRARIEADLREARWVERATAVYQPIVDARTGGVEMVEALLRWTDPELGLVGAAEVVGVAEEIGAISGLGRWMLERSLDELDAVRGQLGPSCRLSVNVSALQLARPAFAEEVARTLEGRGLDPRDLVVEVTESVLVDDPDALRALRRLSELGVTVAVDDFGRGYSSLSYLGDLPVAVVKLDASFLRPSGSGASLLPTVVSLVDGLGLDVVAEGIESEAERESAVGAGCDLLQGYAVGRPGRPEQLSGTDDGWSGRPAPKAEEHR